MRGYSISRKGLTMLRYRVELRRVCVDGGTRLREALTLTGSDAVDAAALARAFIAGMYDEPQAYWRVESVEEEGKETQP
jgi:uncharacterized membrane protein